MTYRLNSDLFYFKFKNKIIYDKVYRNIHRIRIKTESYSKLGQIRFLISRRYKQITIHLYYYNTGIYIKYDIQPRSHKELNVEINKLFSDEFRLDGEFLDPLRDTSITLSLLYLTLDKIAVECKLSPKKLKFVMLQLLKKDLYTRMDIIKWFGLLLIGENHITKDKEPILARLPTYIRHFPMVFSYDPQLHLENYKFSNATEARIPKLTYDEFLETLEGFTDDEILEMIGNYKILTPAEHQKDYKEIFYKLTQRFK
ncbi:hypothetical protein LCGC14_0729080 [marine sediment metagenome]|uniref:Uncharacterized protein n=1 Tax=marine sediment metagenome TaxID=412755 RepID=A0A0F9SVH5_9ZZZZ